MSWAGLDERDARGSRLERGARMIRRSMGRVKRFAARMDPPLSPAT